MTRLAPLLVLACACTTAPKLPPATLLPYVDPPRPVEPVAVKPSHAPFHVRNVTVMTAAGPVYAPGHVTVVDGRIAAVGAGDGSPPAGATVIDGRGGYLTPGLIDTHSHMGVYPMPSAEAHGDGNEITNPVTAHIMSQHAFWPQDPGLWRALSGGVTTVQVLPGSANVIGGRSFVAHLRPAGSALAMRFPGAPEGLKMACGENPKRVYGSKGREPGSRMGVWSTLRTAFQKATEYRRAQQKYARDLAAWQQRQTPRDGGVPPSTRLPNGNPDDPPERPPRDLGLETLAQVLDGKILIHNHCYRADEMHQMLDTAREFGFAVRSFHHAVEAYKLAGRLAREGVAASVWADWWGFKMESFDGVPANAAMVHAAGARAIMHSDSAIEVRWLNQEAAKARAAGQRFGLSATDDEVLRWVTANPAWALGIDDKVGTVENGKYADLVVWNRHPLSVYALAQQVFVEGELVYDRARKDPPLSDFELGIIDGKELP